MEKDFLELVNKHRGILYKVCNLYCHDSEDQKDLFQEIILQLWKSFPFFRKESQASTWMYRVGLNTAISNFRKESRKPAQHSLSEMDFQIPDTSNFLDQAEDLKLLMGAISQLNKLDKAIILLYLDEKSYIEIADLVGISKSNVGVRLNRIKNKLENTIQS